MKTNKMKIGSFLILTILIGNLLGACSSNSPESASSGTNGEIKIATATTTGAYYPIGGVMASILSKNLEDSNFTAEATGGSAENARLIDSGSVQIGFFGADTLAHAYNGEGDFEGKKIDLAGLARLYSNAFHLVTMADSDIETVEDIEGKTVAVGAPGSGTTNKTKILLSEYGIEFGENIKEKYLDFAEGAAALVDGNVDVVVISVGMPSGNIQELTATHDIKIIPFDEQKAKEVGKKHTYFTTLTIPAGTYDGMDEDIVTIGAANDIAVDPEMDEDLVYEITKILYETHYEEFIRSHAVMKGSTLEIAPYTVVPLHPGAERYYKELGVLE